MSSPSYKPLNVISQGNFGSVLKARHNITKEIVAIKRVVKLNSNVNKEFQILTLLKDCENVVKMKEFFFTKNKQGNTIQNIVFEYVEDNMEGMIQRTRNSGNRIPELTVKNLTFELLNGIKQIHRRNVTHRDLKPSNILLKKNGFVKICDFGSSKIINSSSNTPYIVSRPYRAPQLLLCITKYSQAIDIWSVGCILAELFLLEPLFKGVSQGNQLFTILKFLGSFTKAEEKKLEERVPFDKTLFKSMGPFQRKDLRENFRMVEDKQNFIDLLLKMLNYLPQKRITAKEALEHPFFDAVRIPMKSEQSQEITKF